MLTYITGSFSVHLMYSTYLPGLYYLWPFTGSGELLFCSRPLGWMEHNTGSVYGQTNISKNGERDENIVSATHKSLTWCKYTDIAELMIHDLVTTLSANPPDGGRILLPPQLKLWIFIFCIRRRGVSKSYHKLKVSEKYILFFPRLDGCNGVDLEANWHHESVVDDRFLCTMELSRILNWT